MTTDGEGRLHVRLDDLVLLVGEIKKDVSIVATSCKDCRPVVMGNGGVSIDKRVDRLEQRSANRSRWLWAVIATLAAIAGSVVSSAMSG